MRDESSRLTLEIHTQVKAKAKREAQQCILEMMLPEASRETPAARRAFADGVIAEL
jgi:hypothetical protein